MTFISILTLISQTLSVLLLLAATLAFIFKRYINEWIKTRFKIQLEKSNGDYKHKLLHELETYKGDILRELEEFKLGIDIRRNIALQVSNSQLSAYQKLVSDYGIIVGEIHTYTLMDPKIREDLNTFRLRILSADRAARSTKDLYGLFLDPGKLQLPLAELGRSIVSILVTELDPVRRLS